MGGGGGVFSGVSRSPEKIAEKIREMSEASAAQFEVELAAEFSGLLAQFNARNTEETARRLAEIRDLLADALDGTFDTLYGGSVAKHTYVDGISDVDSMLILNGPLAEGDPAAVLLHVSNALREKLDAADTVTVGKVAITVTYPDGSELQLVPTVRHEGKLQVPAWESNTWSTINPQQFCDGLTKRNAECGGKLIPTLKLAKTVNATLPEGARLTGYHIESLGVAAFRDYIDERTTVRMLPHFFRRASDLVLSPIVDKTGQSIHVDSHLGPANSPERVALSHTLARIHQRMLNASAAKSKDRWLDLLGD